MTIPMHDILKRMERARDGLYAATREPDRREDSRATLTDVVTKLDEAIRLLGAKHSRVQHAAFAEYLAANP